MASAEAVDPGRILVFRIGHLGDTIVALPAFRAIRNRYPGAHIAFLCNAPKGDERKVPATAVLPSDGLFDELIGYRSQSGLSGAAEAIALIRRLRKARFDTVFYLMTRNRDRARIERDKRFFRLSGIRDIVGADFVAANNLSFEQKPPLPQVEYEGDFLSRCLEAHGITAGTRTEDLPALRLTESELRSASSWLRAGLDADIEGSKLVGIGPGSKWESKIWSEDRFFEVVDELIKQRDVVPIVFGGPEDREKGERMIARWGRGACAAGSLGVREAGAALSLCSLYLGNDTGTMHLAAAAGARCVAVFAAIDYPGRWSPPGQKHRVFRVSVPCEGCHTPDCFNDHECLKGVRAEEVLKACLEALDAD